MRVQRLPAEADGLMDGETWEDHRPRAGSDCAQHLAPFLEALRATRSPEMRAPRTRTRTADIKNEQIFLMKD